MIEPEHSYTVSLRISGKSPNPDSIAAEISIPDCGISRLGELSEAGVIYQASTISFNGSDNGDDGYFDEIGDRFRFLFEYEHPQIV
ncbi:MAG: hypothetical protein JWP91_3936 [Fibrobacteres bacterium]|nr:hypothetical protein [Fibrobacterota bacterium]